MPHPRDEVVAAVQKTFPESSRSRVLELLDSYGIESYERERERVQLAILKLSEGNEEKLREFVAVAKRDYRDVLFWAENPEEAKLDTPEKRERFRKMFEQFGIKPPESEPDWH
jgi:predicted Fe-Mo cluster-binding NifX family protein